MTQISGRIAQLTADKREILLQRLKEKLETTKRQINVLPRKAEDTFALSFAQERLWFIQQLDPASPIYNIGAAVRIQGQLDIIALEYSLNEIVRRHESLRTVFETVEGRPVQRIKPFVKFDLPQTDLTGYTPDEVYKTLQQHLAQPFDLVSGPLVRLRLFQTGPRTTILLVVIHHIVSDGLSTGLFLAETWQHYQAFGQNRPISLAELPVQYADFAAWQREWLTGRNLEEQSDYWKRQLGRDLPVLDLPTDRPRPFIQTFEGAHYSFHLPHKLVERLEAFDQTEGVTAYMTLLAAFQTLLYRCTGQEIITVGSPIANRTRPDVERLIGFFVNNLVMKGDFSEQPAFREVVRRVQQTAMAAYAHQDLPFEKLVELLQVDRDLSRSPLFQVAFALQENPLDYQPADLELELLELHIPKAKFDLTLEIFKRKDELSGWFEYNPALFDEATIARLYGHFLILLDQALTNPAAPIARLNMLSLAEQLQLHKWNDTTRPFQSDKCAAQLFEAQVAAQPNAIAASYGSQSLTYAGLNERANRLAHYLQAQGVGPDSLTAIYVERSLETVVAILGILKAGGAYLPLDPAYPKERLAYMLADSGAEIVLTSSHVPGYLETRNARLVYLDRDWSIIAAYPATNPTTFASPRDLAYVIYTSGSTGQPKGVALAHLGLVNLAAAQASAFGVGPGWKVLQFASFSFDASVWEVAMSLFSGATLCLCDGDILKQGGASVAQLLEREAINIVTLPPSLLVTMPPVELPNLKIIVVAGEACPEELVKRWVAGRRFFNAYGPTETTVCATMQECFPADNRKPLIGRPLPNTQLYILDKNGQQLPVNVPGELYIGGIQLALGYLNRPTLTAEKFILNPFSDNPEVRLYKTGDLARYLPDGAVEFLGRIDQQVKLRGFRIELEEIETLLRQHPAIQEAILTVRQESLTDQRLVAYFLPRPGEMPSFGELRNFLKEKLPDYMVPSAFVMLQAVPMTPNGKIDKKALPAPASMSKASAAQVVPQTGLERSVADIWQEVLKVERVSVQDNFFEIGGYSLLMVEIHKKLQERLGREISIISLFKYPTVQTLAKHLASQESSPPQAQVQQTIQASQDRARQQREAQARQRQQQAVRKQQARD